MDLIPLNLRSLLKPNNLDVKLIGRLEIIISSLLIEIFLFFENKILFIS